MLAACRVTATEGEKYCHSAQLLLHCPAPCAGMQATKQLKAQGRTPYDILT